MTMRSMLVIGAISFVALEMRAEENARICKAPVVVPATFEIVTEQILDQPERTEIQTVPAKYESVERQFQVQAPTIQYKIVPAIYETVTEQVQIKPERTETVVIPAEYESYTEQILVQPAHTVWRLRPQYLGEALGLDERSSIDLKDYFEAVDVPAEYQSVTRTRIVTPERSETRIIPAQYQTLVKRVVVEPSRIEEVHKPAEYEIVQVEELVAPAREEFVSVPATYRTIEKKVAASEAVLSWRDAPCEDQLSVGDIRRIQEALATAGFQLEIDGVLGPTTLNSLSEYQRKNGLAEGRVTFESLNMLGVQLTQ